MDPPPPPPPASRSPPQPPPRLQPPPQLTAEEQKESHRKTHKKITNDLKVLFDGLINIHSPKLSDAQPCDASISNSWKNWQDYHADTMMNEEAFKRDSKALMFVTDLSKRMDMFMTDKKSATWKVRLRCLSTSGSEDKELASDVDYMYVCSGMNGTNMMTQKSSACSTWSTRPLPKGLKILTSPLILKSSKRTYGQIRTRMCFQSSKKTKWIFVRGLKRLKKSRHKGPGSGHFSWTGAAQCGQAWHKNIN